MTNEQFEIIVELLKSIDSRLSFIEDNTGNTESNVSNVEDELQKINKVITDQS